MNDEGFELMLRTILKLEEKAEAHYLLTRRTFVEFADRLDALTLRVAALEAAKAAITYPPIEPERLEKDNL